ncbi:TRAP transporter small permease subunit [Aquimonas voraii]|uniref:TRAP transporter small permease protein n=1 Tax=Aquimonas voraii TaxID=265719 RepID=A0A1G6WMG2_9GAMM|nr:TRAP transporter small permease subunit [Aquimonas voraii]SDD67038.1 TRAP-type mannitol/chloroaromatic compound transport system, small permease component [Aquimonas voraii]
MIDALHAFGLAAADLRLLGIALPLWLLAVLGLLLVAMPQALDTLQRWLGAALTALTPLVVLLCFGLVAARYGFGKGSVAVQEAMLWLHACVFMLGMAWALRHERHVRVDVLHARLSPRSRAWIEAGGHLVLLLPFALFLVWVSLDYVAASWLVRESSREPGGLPALFLLKSLIPLSAWLLAVQSLALFLQRLRAALSTGAPA